MAQRHCGPGQCKKTSNGFGPVQGCPAAIAYVASSMLTTKRSRVRWTHELAMGAAGWDQQGSITAGPGAQHKLGEFFLIILEPFFLNLRVALFEFPTGLGVPGVPTRFSMSELKCKIGFAGMGPECCLIPIYTSLHPN